MSEGVDKIQEMRAELAEIKRGLTALRLEVVNWLANCNASQERLHDLDHIVRGNDRPGLDKRVDRLEQRRLISHSLAWAAVVLASASGGALLNWFLQ